jgi:tRNA (mo5U34)-methyltransferase
MRLTPPKDFDLAGFTENFYAFQQWELFPGYVVPGVKRVEEQMENLQMPQRLDGLRVLDIAPWNGYFGFECLRRGAAELVSLGPDDPEVTGYNKTRDLLEIENCRYVRASVYDLSPEKHGQFDVVLFLGLIYHLRHPLLALDLIFDVALKRLYVDSPIINNVIFDKTVTDDQREKLLLAGKVMHELPLTYFTKGAETGDPYNWFMPNKLAFIHFIESAGFTKDSYFDDGGWASMSATKNKREFTQGLEGWNEAVSRTRSAQQGQALSASPPWTSKLQSALGKLRGR